MLVSDWLIANPIFVSLVVARKVTLICLLLALRLGRVAGAVGVGEGGSAFLALALASSALCLSFFFLVSQRVPLAKAQHGQVARGIIALVLFSFRRRYETGRAAAALSSPQILAGAR